ncbi:MAG: hypothetical protein JXQ72_13835 [Anaerolineae bacterium]|nr:hypothetical protein [Anaerolineae bacterium]
MPITIEWDNDDHTVILWTLSGQWTWADIRTTQADYHDMLRTVDHMVDVIGDMRHSTTVPLKALPNFQSLMRGELPNRDRIVLVGSGTVIERLADTFNRVFRRGQRPLFLLAGTVEEARDLLAGE